MSTLKLFRSFLAAMLLIAMVPLNLTQAQSTLSPWDVSWIPSDSTGRAKIVGEINSILGGTGMAGMGQAILDNAIIYKVNPALALAQFRKEASFAASGTLGAINNNPGNIIYTGGYYGESGKNGRFGAYASMADGIKAFYMLLDRQYKDLSTVQQIVNRYAPSGDGDNNPTQYAAQISGWGATYQAQMIKAINGGEPPVIVTTVPPPTVKAPRAPTLAYPNQNSTLDPKLWMSFIWTSVPEATQYYVEYWGGPYSTLNSGWINHWNYYVGEMWAGTYSWRVKARNIAGESAWSDTWTFTVPEKVTAPPIVIITTEPPPAKASAPSLSAPSHNASFDQQTSIEFNWNSAANATSYYLEYWGGAYGTLNSGWISGTSYKVGQMWQGAYSWRVKSRNAQGESDWSETRAFTIKSPDTVTPPPVVTTPPPVVTTVAPKLSAPSLANPANSGVYEQKTEITFSWNGVNGATGYYLEYWGGPYGTLNSGWISGTSYKVGQMWAGAYSWHVKSRNASSESDWSATWTFTIKDVPKVVVTTPPPVIVTTVAPPQPEKLPAPSLANPSNGGSYPQSTEIVLSWNASSNATQYKVELWGGPYSTMTPCNWQSGTSCRIGQMWQGTMSWKVKARDASGRESDWSETWTFTIRDNPTTPAPIVTTPPPVITTQSPTTPPPAKAASPSLANPSNGGSYEQRTEITFTWNSSANANQYYVEYWGGPYGTLNSGWIGGTSYRIGQMWPGSYQWHVKSRNSAGESGWSETWSFTIKEMPTTVAPKVVTTEPPKVVTTQPPQQPSLNAPSPSFPNNGGKYAQKTEITLQWNSASGATQYKVELWGGPYSTMTPCNWQRGTSCRIGQMWPGTMSWKVKARDASGRESDWSGTWTFTIQ